MGHTHSLQISGRGCQILPWSWERAGPAWSESPKGADTEGESALRTMSEMSRMGRRKPLSFTLHRNAGISLTGGNAYSLMFSQGWTNTSMPRGAGELRENQSGHWDDSCDAKRFTSASPNRSQIWTTVWRFSIHSPGLRFYLDRKSAARFKTPGKWTALRESNLFWDQKRRWQAWSGCATVNSLGDLCGIPPPCCPSWLSHDTLWEGGESRSVPGRRLWAPGSLRARRGTLQSKQHALVCLRRPHPSLSMMRPS